MKCKASILLRQIYAVLSSRMKAKSMAIKRKTNAIKRRIIIFSLLRNKKVLLPAISRRIHALLGHVKKNIDDSDPNKAIVVYNEAPPPNPCQTLSVVDDIVGEDEEEEDDDKYPYLTHLLFDELEFDDGSKSVIDLVKDAREDKGSNFNLEDEIDHVADVFIRRFRRQLLMQKQDSFKRYKEMLDRSL